MIKRKTLLNKKKTTKKLRLKLAYLEVDLALDL